MRTTWRSFVIDISYCAILWRTLYSPVITSVVEDMAQAQLKMGAGAGGRRQRRQRIDFPCIICDEKCGMDTIACDDCACWAHRTCVPLTPTQFQELSKKGRPFRCRRCVCDRSNGKFNYFRSLKRYGISFLCLKFVKTFNVSSLNIALGLQACQTTASAGFKFRQGSTAKGYKVGQSRVCGIGLRCHRQVIRVANRCSAERH